MKIDFVTELGHARNLKSWRDSLKNLNDIIAVCSKTWSLSARLRQSSQSQLERKLFLLPKAFRISRQHVVLWINIFHIWVSIASINVTDADAVQASAHESST